MKRIVSFLLQTDQVFYSISLEETKGTRLNQLGKNSRTLACLFQNSKMVRPNDVYDQEPYHASLLDTAQVSGQVKELESLMKIHDREVGIFESYRKSRSLRKDSGVVRLNHRRALKIYVSCPFLNVVCSVIQLSTNPEAAVKSL